MKKIIEVKRGDPVPSHAVWLKDTVKHNYATYDVFEVEDEPPKEKKVKGPKVSGRCDSCGGGTTDTE